MIWFLAIVAFIVLAFFVASNNEKKEKEEFEKKGLNYDDLKDSGKYLSGHNDLDNPLDMTYLLCNKSNIDIYAFDKVNAKKVFKASIPKEDVLDVHFEDESTIQTRVGLKRMLALGIFAFAVKKKQKIELAYIVIEWNYGKFKNETVFEFEGNAAITRANSLRNKLIKFINE